MILDVFHFSNQKSLIIILKSSFPANLFDLRTRNGDLRFAMFLLLKSKIVNRHSQIVFSCKKPLISEQ